MYTTFAKYCLKHQVCNKIKQQVFYEVTCLKIVVVSHTLLSKSKVAPRFKLYSKRASNKLAIQQTQNKLKHTSVISLRSGFGQGCHIIQYTKRINVFGFRVLPRDGLESKNTSKFSNEMIFKSLHKGISRRLNHNLKARFNTLVQL